MSIFSTAWFTRRGGDAPRRKLAATVELRAPAHQRSASSCTEPEGDAAEAPAWPGVVATIRGSHGDRSPWMADQFEPWPTGAGFVFSSIGVIPPAALREVSGLRSVRTEPRRRRAARAESVTGDLNH